MDEADDMIFLLSWKKKSILSPWNQLMIPEYMLEVKCIVNESAYLV